MSAGCTVDLTSDRHCWYFPPDPTHGGPSTGDHKPGGTVPPAPSPAPLPVPGRAQSLWKAAPSQIAMASEDADPSLMITTLMHCLLVIGALLGWPFYTAMTLSPIPTLDLARWLSILHTLHIGSIWLHCRPWDGASCPILAITSTEREGTTLMKDGTYS